MTDEQMRVAIAEARGIPGPWRERITACGCDGQWDLFNEVGVRLPDYLNDRDSMHSALLALPLELRGDFVKALAQVVAPGTPDPDTFHPFTWITASARQLAEAFLRAIGKWK